MNGYEEEQLENMKRVAERGLALATSKENKEEWDSDVIDGWQRILDLYGEIKWSQEK